MVASRSLFVEGEATGGTVPGLHPTTEMPLAALVGDEPSQVQRVWVRTPAAPDAGHSAQAARTAPATPRRRTASARIPRGYVYWKTVRAKVTAYDPSRRSCGKFADGKTSIGQNAWVADGVASDPRAIPYGTYVVIPGVGVKEVDDTGKAMRNSWRRHRRYHIDLRMTYPWQANRWGVKYLDIKLYRKTR
ncbi:MAG: 3D domain-containing protein [Planctomycetes bacterium]|nr:3D domain-containing protein [Planctomycetota bacterium]